MPKKMPARDNPLIPALTPRPDPKPIDYDPHTLTRIKRLSEDIKLPTDEYRLDLLLPPGPEGRLNRTTFFESERWCSFENIRRGFELERAVRNIDRVMPPPRTEEASAYLLRIGIKETIRELSLDLAARLRSGGDRTLLSSASFKRQQRIRLLGAIMQLLDNHRELPIRLARIRRTDFGWQIPTLDLCLLDFKRITREQLKCALKRAGLSQAGGLFIAHCDIEFHPPYDECQVYFYAVVSGKKTRALKNIQTLEGYAGNSVVYFPFPSSGPDWSQRVASALSRFWPQQTWKQFGFRLNPSNASRPSRFRSQQQALYLTAFDYSTASDIFVFDGVELTDGELQRDSPFGTLHSRFI
jgi:hypothetical protein